MTPLYGLGDFGQGVKVALMELEPDSPADIAACLLYTSAIAGQLRYPQESHGLSDPGAALLDRGVGTASEQPGRLLVPGQRLAVWLAGAQGPHVGLDGRHEQRGTCSPVRDIDRAADHTCLLYTSRCV